MTVDEPNLLPENGAPAPEVVRPDPVPVLPVADTPGDDDLLRALRLFHLALSPEPDEAGPMRPLPATPGDGNPADIDRAAPLRLMLDAAVSEYADARAAFLEERRTAAAVLRGLLEMERLKKPEGRSADAVKGALGSVGSRFVNPGALSGLLGAPRGSVPMAPAREAQIRGALERLETAVASEDLDPVLVHDGCLDDLDEGALAGWRVERTDRPCAAATEAFDADAAALAEDLRDVRRARLEERGEYEPSRHDPWLAQFGWPSFSPRERTMVRPVVAVLTREALVAGALQDLSDLLHSGRPLQAVVLVDPARLPAPDAPERFGTRLEPGYLGMSHRDVLVWQSSASHPDHLREGFRRGMHASRAALHVIAVPRSTEAGTPLDRAVAGRAHPLFSYDPERGGSWARRFSFGGNPDPAADWPRYRLAVRSDGGDELQLDLATTFADCALSDPANRVHFRAVPDDALLEELVPLDEYLALPEDEAPTKVPFVHGLDGAGRVRRLVLSRVLTLAARDRLDFWRTLEELAGVRSEYVDVARNEVRAAMELRNTQEREKLLAEHGVELEGIRRQAAEEAVQRLTATLLGEDPPPAAAAPVAPAAAPPAAPADPVPAAAPPAPAEVAPEPAAPAPAEEAPAAAEPPEDMDPYIDTPLCTSCNECTQLNPMMFAYDDEKKAYIKDPTAGTYRDLVVAAEKCTARIIHPGTPLNPDEPGLEDLIRRAAPFNNV